MTDVLTHAVSASSATCQGTCPNSPANEPPIDLTLLDGLIEEFKGRKGAVIPILQRAQDIYGYLPKAALKEISRRAGIPLQQLYGVATFYTQFRLTRRGRHLVRICDGTACHVRGAPKAIDAIGKAIGIKPGDTSPDYKMTFEIVYCLGSCGLAPVALVDEKVVGRLSADGLVSKLQSLD